MSRDGQQRVEKFFELSIDMLCVAGTDGYFKLLNPIWSNVLGFTEAELLSTPFLSFVHPDDRAATVEAVADLANRPRISFRNRYRHRDGTYRTFDWSGALSTEEQVIYCVARDVTDRDRELARLDHLLRASRIVLFSARPGGDFAVNFMSENVLDYEASQFRGDPDFWLAHVHPDDVARVLEELERLLQRGQNAYDYRYLHQDGTYRWVRDDCKVMRDQSGNPVEIVGTWYDVTEKRRSEELIREQATALTELSTPLIPISEEVLVMPLIGTMDSQRVKQVLDTLLQGVSATRASVAILDITGVAVVDSQVANALILAAKAVRLLGAEVVLTGIRPDVAHTLVGLGVDLGDIITRGTLQSGIGYAMERAERAD
jgi:rsbT co-antagonist protein RsbR